MKTGFRAATVAVLAASALACAPRVLAGPAAEPTAAMSGDGPILLAQARSGAAARGTVTTQGDDRYGTPATGMPYDREIRLGAGTRGVNVARLETVRFVTADGREFRWTFDTFRRFEVFPLADIAPAGISVPAGTTVYVVGDIPVAP